MGGGSERNRNGSGNGKVRKPDKTDSTSVIASANHAVTPGPTALDRERQGVIHRECLKRESRGSHSKEERQHAKSHGIGFS